MSLQTTQSDQHNVNGNEQGKDSQNRDPCMTAEERSSATTQKHLNTDSNARVHAFLIDAENWIDMAGKYCYRS